MHIPYSQILKQHSRGFKSIEVTEQIREQAKKFKNQHFDFSNEYLINAKGELKAFNDSKHEQSDKHELLNALHNYHPHAVVYKRGVKHGMMLMMLLIGLLWLLTLTQI